MHAGKSKYKSSNNNTTHLENIIHKLMPTSMFRLKIMKMLKLCIENVYYREKEEYNSRIKLAECITSAFSDSNSNVMVNVQQKALWPITLD